MAKLQSTENMNKEMHEQSTEQASHKRLCKRNRLFSGSWRTRQRRGVLLLVSLVLLVMFLMLGVTFVLTAGNFRRSSEAYQRMLERPSADLPERSGDLLDSVAHDLVRGTSSQDSPFSEENLLEDLYGRPALRGRVKSVPISGQLTELTVDLDADFTSSQVQDYYAGLVLTMLTGKCAGKSTRIVGSQWNAADSITLKVVDFPGSKSPGGDDPDTGEKNGDLFLVNGRPFSGDGSDTSGRQLNEDYDKADANNPWLASRDDTGEITSETASFAKQADWNADSRPVTITHDDGSTTQVVVDNDGDGEKDSVWLDVGLPLQLQPDGSYVKPLVAMLVRDLDGRVNLNAHGSALQIADSGDPSVGRLGLGYGPAEIDPKFVLLPGRTTYNDDDVKKIDAFVASRRSEAVGQTASSDNSNYDPDNPPDSADHPIQETNQAALGDFFQFGDKNSLVTPIDPHGLNQVDSSLLDQNGNVALEELADGASEFTDNPYGKQLDTFLDIPKSHDPYIPNDLERVLRFSDADADAIDSRLYKNLARSLFGSEEIDPDDLKKFRERITTESWDLPVAGLSWPQELSEKLSDTPSPGHITDLFAARFKKEDSSITDDVARQRAAALMVQLDPSNPFDTNANPPTPRYVDADGNLIDQTEDDWEEKIVRRGLISPGLTRGTRFNVNRLLGNGVDDSEASGPGYRVVDEPGEFATEMITAPGYFDPNDSDDGGTPFDHDGNGTPGQPEDKRARQHYAQQLYLLLMLLADDLETNVPGITDPDDQRRLLARRLAQFAVNAVDYRDPDSIMTPFEYDANPFDAGGWLAEADGDLTTSPSSKTEYGVVWGCESPAAVLTQTLAFHDRRVRDDASVGGESSELDWSELQSRLDVFVGNAANAQQGETLDITDEFINNRMTELRTANDPSSGSDTGLPFEDPHFDQVARPEGAFFFEVQAVPQAFAPNFPQDLYDAKRLDLAKKGPEGYPIWRVAISDSLPPKPDAAGADRALLGDPPFYALRDADADRQATSAEKNTEAWNPFVTMQPESFDPLEYTSGGGSNEVLDQIPIERIVYFDYKYGNSAPYPGRFRGSTADNTLKTHQQNLPGGGASWDGNYYCELKDDPLDNDQRYAYRLRADADDSVEASDRTLVVGPQDTTTIRSSTFNGGSDISLATVANNATVERSNVNNTSSNPRMLLSISEPLASEAQYPPNDSSDTYASPIDKPLDHDADWLRALANVFAPEQQSYPPQNSPQTLIITDPEDAANTADLILEKDLVSANGGQRFFTPQWAAIEEGTVPHYRTAFLQRLADPTMAWNATTNPYITVDAMPIDLNVYNSDSTTADPWQKVKGPAALGKPETNFGNYDPEFKPEQLTTDIETAISTVRSSAGHASPSATSQFEFLSSTEPLGKIRKRTSLFAGAGQLNDLSGSPFGSPSAPYSKTIPAPFWPNRPFVSQYELLMVPASEPGKLTFELGSHTGSTESNFTDGFPHTLNFFFQDSNQDPQLGRLFDYLHVPSKFAGTQISLDPGSLSEVPGFAPPFNVVSTYREPGRVNLNTIEDSEVWKAVMHGEPSSDPSVSKPHHGPAHSSLQDTYHGPGEVSGVDGESVAMPLLSSSLGFEGTDPNSPFLRYQPINRMGNLTTTRSNVYAVWMTLGFFETTKEGRLDSPPVEAGGSGLERHRAFYMIDRSIPVGYENGHDHNTEDVFRVKRYIE